MLHFNISFEFKGRYSDLRKLYTARQHEIAIIFLMKLKKLVTSLSKS